MPDLAYGMKMDPKMKVMLAGGYYDLATPYFEGVYEMRHLPMPHNLQSNISYHYYDAGHMIYVKDDILKQFKIDIANFIKSSETANNPARLASPTGQHAFALALSVPFRSSAVAVAIALALV